MLGAFFPNAIFGWLSFAALLMLLATAAVFDWRTIRIPKRISLTVAATGLAFQTVRGAWLGAAELPVWMLGAHGPVVGAFDALAFGLAGFAVGFVLMLAFFAAGGCGGGDVKLFAGVSIWVGAWLALWIFVIAALVLTLLGLIGVAVGGARGTAMSVPAAASATAIQRPAGRANPWMTYSLPLTLATLAVMLWFYYPELRVLP